MTQNEFRVTNFYNNGLRTNLSLAQPTGSWTNGFGYDLPHEINMRLSSTSTITEQVVSNSPQVGHNYLTGQAKRLTSVASKAGAFGVNP